MRGDAADAEAHPPTDGHYTCTRKRSANQPLERCAVRPKSGDGSRHGSPPPPKPPPPPGSPKESEPRLSHSAALITAAFKEMSDSDSDCSQHGSAPLSVAESCTSQEYEILIAELDDVPTLNHSPSRGSSRGSAHGSAQGSPPATPKRVGKAASILSRATNSRELARVDTISFGTMVRATGLSIADSSPCTSADGSALPAGSAA